MGSKVPRFGVSEPEPGTAEPARGTRNPEAGTRNLFDRSRGSPARVYAGSSANAADYPVRAPLLLPPTIANATALLRRTDGDCGSRASAFENASIAVSIALSPRVMMAVRPAHCVFAAREFVHHTFRHAVQLGHRLTGLSESIQHARGCDANRRLIRIDRDRLAVVIERFRVAAGRLVRLSGADVERHRDTDVQ